MLTEMPGFGRKWYTVHLALPSSGTRIGPYVESRTVKTDRQKVKNKNLTQQNSQSLLDLYRYICEEMGWQVYWSHQDLNLERSFISWVFLDLVRPCTDSHKQRSQTEVQFCLILIYFSNWKFYWDYCINCKE